MVTKETDVGVAVLPAAHTEFGVGADGFGRCLSLLQGDTCALARMCCWVVCPRAGVGQVVSTPQGYRHPWSVCCLRFGVGNLVGQRFIVTGYCYFRAGELPVTYGGRK